jgi:hypothetical protein
MNKKAFTTYPEGRTSAAKSAGAPSFENSAEPEPRHLEDQAMLRRALVRLALFIGLLAAGGWMLSGHASVPAARFSKLDAEQSSTVPSC